MEYKIYAGGDFVKSDSEISVKNPYNNKVVAKTWLADNSILENSIKKALSVKDECAKIPSYKKFNILKEISAEIIKRENEFAEIIASEAAKPLKYALGEVRRAAQTFSVAAEEAKRVPREYIGLDWTADAEKKEGFLKYFPVGVIAGISPFNFPLNLAVHKIAPAIAAGCPIILKPATSTPLATLKLAQIIDKLPLPKGAISVLPMDRKTGNKLVADERFKLLTFTGSPEVGWKMKSNAGKKKVVLELGGNAGTIISESADIENAINQSVTGGFAYQGQVCIHSQRFFVKDSVFDVFVNGMVEKTKKLAYGDPLSDKTEITSMIDEQNAERVEEWVNEAKAEGAEILCGGKRNGSYYEPTILINTKPGMKVNKLEIFGPVITIEPYNDFISAVNSVNNSDFGLQTSVFTNSISEMDYAFENIESGSVIINSATIFRMDHMPYGGVKDSGTGREGVKYAIHDMMEPKLLVKNF